MIEGLDAPMTGDACRAELFDEKWREPLKAACAEDPDIWPIYSISFDPDHFDQSIDLFSGARNNRTFVLFAKNAQGDEELAGMSSFLGIDEGRQCLEIGGTYYRPHLRGTGFMRRIHRAARSAARSARPPGSRGSRRKGVRLRLDH